MLKVSLLAAGVAAVALAPAPAPAAPLHLTPALGLQSADSHVIEVQGRRHWRGGHWRGHRGRDALIGLGIGSAIVGGMIAAQPYGYYDYGPAYGSAPYAYGGAPYAYADGGWQQCAAEFRSLRQDGTYTTYDGRQVLCPYLR